MTDRPITRTDAEWRELLTPLQFSVLRESATERAFTGEHWRTTTPGTYVCSGCQTPLFKSDQKFVSGCGWPSFFDEIPGDRVEIKMDRTHGMVREEIVCAACGGHLGHRFPDGPPPTGVRYCVNSASIELIADAEGEPPATAG